MSKKLGGLSLGKGLLQLANNLLDGLRQGIESLLLGSRGNDVIAGGEKSDLIVGLKGADELFGNGGNDLLIGSSSDDVLAGGAGHELRRKRAALLSPGRRLTGRLRLRADPLDRDLHQHS